jgi:hypothetical protein
VPERVTIMNRPLWARILLPIWAFQVWMGLYFFWLGLRALGLGATGIGILIMVVGLFAAVASVVMVGQCWRIARLDGPAVEIGPDGLRDLRLSPEVLPWEAVSWRLVFTGLSYGLHFDLAEPVRSRVRPGWPQRFIAIFNRLFRYPEFTVAPLGTGLPAQKIAQHMAGFKPPSDAK